MDLSKLIPTETYFYLRLPKRKFTMKPITLMDEIWIEKNYENGIEEIFNTLDIKEISRIAYRLLSEEDKEFLGKKEVVFRNEEGEEITEVMGGVKFLTSLISGSSEKESVIIALIENIGLSRAIIDEIMEADKKKALNQKSQQTGE